MPVHFEFIYMFQGLSLAQLYCPDCKTHEGSLECHPGPHTICNANEVGYYTNKTISLTESQTKLAPCASLKMAILNGMLRLLINL